MKDGMIEVKDRHAFVVFFKTDESGFVPVGQVRDERPPDAENILGLSLDSGSVRVRGMDVMGKFVPTTDIFLMTLQKLCS